MNLFKYNPGTLEYEKIPVVKLVKPVIGLLILSVIIGFGVSPRATVTNLTPEEKLIVIREYNEFSKQKLVQRIKALNLKFPHIVMAQAIQETGNFTSTIFKENHNLFGMKQPTVRNTLAEGTSRGHAKYSSWQDSLTDYALFISTYGSEIKTEGEYFEFLRQVYAEDPDYVTRLKTIINKSYGN